MTQFFCVQEIYSSSLPLNEEVDPAELATLHEELRESQQRYQRLLQQLEDMENEKMASEEKASDLQKCVHELEAALKAEKDKGTKQEKVWVFYHEIYTLQEMKQHYWNLLTRGVHRCILMKSNVNSVHELSKLLDRKIIQIT